MGLRPLQPANLQPSSIISIASLYTIQQSKTQPPQPYIHPAHHPKIVLLFVRQPRSLFDPCMTIMKSGIAHSMKSHLCHGHHTFAIMAVGLTLMLLLSMELCFVNQLENGGGAPPWNIVATLNDHHLVSGAAAADNCSRVQEVILGFDLHWACTMSSLIDMCLKFITVSLYRVRSLSWVSL